MKKPYIYHADVYYINTGRFSLFTWDSRAFIRYGSNVKQINRGWFNSFIEQLADTTPEQAADKLAAEFNCDRVGWAW